MLIADHLQPEEPTIVKIRIRFCPLRSLRDCTICWRQAPSPSWLVPSWTRLRRALHARVRSPPLFEAQDRDWEGRRAATTGHPRCDQPSHCYRLRL